MSKIVCARVAAGNPVIRVYLEGTDGAAEPDLTFGSSGLKIEYQRELSSSATVFSGSNLEDITTIGTYAAPTSGKARFKEMSGTTLQGWYEIHLPQAAVGTADASRYLVGMVSGVTGLRDCPFEIELVPDAIPNDSTQLARVTDVTTVGTAVATVDTVVDTILVDTAELQADWVNGGRLDLILDARASQTSVDTIDNFLDTEIAAILALLDDPRTEPGQGAPPVNPDLATKIDYLYKAWRNKKEQTATLLSIYADNGTTVDHKSTVSDDGTTFTAGEIVTGA